MRACGARQVVDLLSAGATPERACVEMLEDAQSLPDDFAAELRALALTPDGRHGGASVRPGSVYVLMTADHGVPEMRPRRLV